MKVEDNGLWITKAEITALLEFVGDPTQPELYAVHLHVDPLSAWVYASDGRRAVEVQCSASDDEEQRLGDWQIDPGVFAELRKVLSSDQVAILRLAPEEITRAAVVSIDEVTGEARELSSITWPASSVGTQVTIDALRSVIKIPRSERAVKCLSLPGSQLAALALVVKATGRECIDLYAPKAMVEPLIFAAESESTRWLGAIMPMRGDDNEDDGETKREKKAKQHRKSRNEELPGL